MSKQITIPKDVWEAIKTIRLFCGTHECHNCSILADCGECTLRIKNAENWFSNYAPLDSDTITLKEEEEKC